MSSVTQMQDGYFEAALFDLDGTLVDTAPDMVGVLHTMQKAADVELIDYEIARAQVSNGAIGLLSVAFPDVELEMGDDLHEEYLERYAEAICQESLLFPGALELLEDLEAGDCPWGIVTNKPEHLTVPLLDALGLLDRAACVISGDSLPVRKPDPAPLLLACDVVGVEPYRAIYVGDAGRDIEAGLSAGMATVAVTYGYIVEDDDPREWGADIIAPDTQELAQIILKAVNLESE